MQTWRFYIGETVFNGKMRWNEHEDKNRKSELAKHLKQYPTRKFTWTIISKGLADDGPCKFKGWVLF